LDAQIKAARALATPEGRKTAVELSKRAIPPPSFDALLLAATGDQLGQITSLLPYYDIDRPAVRVLGPALWANPATRGGADLTGAWYAAPDPAARGQFDQQYTARFGQPAPGLADLAYDAAAIARVVASGGGFSPASLARPEGFAGVNGVLGLQPDGGVRRGLAVFEIQRGGAQMIEPAPDTLGAPGS
jgi:branched-chain amino acid transport system substrate-binding protein